MGGEFFYRFVNFFASILVARSLGSEGFGKFSFIYVYLSFFEAFVELGMNPILTRRIAQRGEEAPKILGNAILVRIALVLLAFPVALFLTRRLGYPLSVQQGIFLAYFQLFLTLRSIYETIFRVHLAMFYPALCNGVRASINFLLVAIVAFASPHLPFFILAYLVSGIVGLAGLIFFSRRFTPIFFEPDFRLIKALVKESAPIVISGYLSLLYCRVDVLMLSLMKGFSDVGYYSAATRITESLTVIANALLASLFPLLSRSFKEDRPHFERLVAYAFRGLFLVGLPIALGGTFVGRDLMTLLFGSEYAPSGITLTILCWFVLLCFQAVLLANILIACGKQWADMWISSALALANIGMNLLLIPHYGYNGAAFATALTEGVGVAIYLAYAAKNSDIRIPLPLKEVVLALKVNLPFLIFLVALRFLGVPVIPLILLQVFLYGILLMLFRLISWNDLKHYLSHSFARA